VYGFVHPSTGESEFFFLPSVSNELTNIAFEEFSNARKLKDPDAVIILLIDGAGFHSLKNIEIPENIIPFKLPPYSPQLQPVECAWPLLREPVANKNFPSMDSLEETLAKRVNYLMSHPNVLK
jgi:transposase